jgi:hypothetical protein
LFLVQREVLSVYVEQRRGSADHPLSSTDVEQKFKRLASTSLSVSDNEEVMNVVQRLERAAAGVMTSWR